MIAAEGTSIITPSRTLDGGSWPSAASRAATASRRALGLVDLLARRDHRQHHPQLAARRPPRSAELIVEQVRTPQSQPQPANAQGRVGFGGRRCHSAGLSPPTSRVRKTTGRPPIASRIRPYAARCSPTEGGVGPPEEQQLVRTRPMPSAPARAAASASSAEPTFATIDTPFGETGRRPSNPTLAARPTARGPARPADTARPAVAATSSARPARHRRSGASPPSHRRPSTCHCPPRLPPGHGRSSTRSRRPETEHQRDAQRARDDGRMSCRRAAGQGDPGDELRPQRGDRRGIEVSGDQHGPRPVRVPQVRPHGAASGARPPAGRRRARPRPVPGSSRRRPRRGYRPVPVARRIASSAARRPRRA